MKYVLFVCLIAALPSAYALSSTADCARVLSDQVWVNPKFTKIARLNGELDGGGEITLLLRVPRINHVLALPGHSALKNPRALSFTDDVATYHVVHGKITDLKKDLGFVVENNARGKLGYQVLDRIPDEAITLKLGTELARRAPILKTLVKPLVALDRWMARHPAYQRVRSWIGEHTLDARTATATRLHRWRNPLPNVRANVRPEVRSYLDPVNTAPVDARESMITKRLQAFFLKHVPDVAPLTTDGSLSEATLFALNLLAPEEYRANAAKVDDAKLSEWKFNRLVRARRLPILERAWTLIAAATWSADRPDAAFTMFEIERTIAEFERRVAAERRLPADRLSIDAWIENSRASEVLDRKFARLQRQRPLTVIEGPDDLRWVLVQAEYARTIAPDQLVREVERAGYRSVSGPVAAQIRRGLKDDGETVAYDGIITSPLGAETLNRIAFAQQVYGLRPLEATRSRVFVVPLELDAEVVSLRDVEGDEVASPRRQGALAKELPYLLRFALGRNGLYEILHREWGEADYRLIRFNYEERENQRPLATVHKVAPINREVEVRFWRRLATQNGVEKIDVAVETEPKFTFEGVGLKRIQFEAWSLTESRVKNGLTADANLLAEILRDGEPVVIDPESRCADVAHGGQSYEVCFGNIMKKFGRVKSIRVRTETQH